MCRIKCKIWKKMENIMLEYEKLAEWIENDCRVQRLNGVIS